MLAFGTDFFFLGKRYFENRNFHLGTPHTNFHLEDVPLQTLYTQMSNLCGFNSPKKYCGGVTYYSDVPFSGLK